MPGADLKERLIATVGGIKPEPGYYRIISADLHERGLYWSTQMSLILWNKRIGEYGGDLPGRSCLLSSYRIVVCGLACRA